MSTKNRERLKYFYNRCDPARPIKAEDPEKFYVDFDAQGLRGDPCIDTLCKRIELYDHPTCQLFTGFSGSGKSTEWSTRRWPSPLTNFWVSSIL